METRVCVRRQIGDELSDSLESESKVSESSCRTMRHEDVRREDVKT